MNLKKRTKIEFLKSYFFIAVGLFINALGWTAFLLPSKIVGGGVSGIGVIIFYATGFPVGFTILMVNIILIFIAIKILGKNFGINTLYGIGVLSLFFMLLQYFITEPIVEERFMASILGGILAGAGVGISLSNGGNSGGTEIVALIVTKYRNIGAGRVLLYIDLGIIASSYFLPPHSLENIVYGYVSMAVASYTIDMIVEGKRQTYQMLILSEKSEIIADRIVSEIKRGVTALKGKGWYTKKDHNILMVIVRKNDKQAILQIINQTDPKAFISIAKTMGVFGENFDSIKL